MKIEKTASGSKRVTISRGEWLAIGEKHGWVATAQVAPTGRNNADFWGENARKDLYTIVNTSEALFAHARNLKALVDANAATEESSRKIGELSISILSDLGWLERMKPTVHEIVSKMNM